MFLVQESVRIFSVNVLTLFCTKSQYQIQFSPVDSSHHHVAPRRELIVQTIMTPSTTGTQTGKRSKWAEREGDIAQILHAYYRDNSAQTERGYGLLLTAVACIVKDQELPRQFFGAFLTLYTKHDYDLADTIYTICELLHCQYNDKKSHALVRREFTLFTRGKEIIGSIGASKLPNMFALAVRPRTLMLAQVVAPFARR